MKEQNLLQEAVGTLKVLRSHKIDCQILVRQDDNSIFMCDKDNQVILEDTKYHESLFNAFNTKVLIEVFSKSIKAPVIEINNTGRRDVFTLKDDNMGFFVTAGDRVFCYGDTLLFAGGWCLHLKEMTNSSHLN